MADFNSPDKSPNLSFHPLSEGLGFHPFSDGLPYAPLSKGQSKGQRAGDGQKDFQRGSQPSRGDLSQGDGAIAAGPQKMMPFTHATIRRSSGVIPQVSVPTANRENRMSNILIDADSKKIKSPPSDNLNASLFGYSYLFKRSLAYLLDFFLDVFLISGAMELLIWKQNINRSVFSNPTVMLIFILFLFGSHWILMTSQEVLFKTTVGKSIFGLKLRGSSLMLVLRAFFFIPSSTFFGLGLIWGLFDSQKRCWHDRVVNIQPQEIAKL
jgi:hypothetical protein